MSTSEISPSSDFDNSRVFRTYITYKEELEKFLSTHKHVPQNFEFWPHGPYWPYNESRHDENLQIVLRTPRHIRTIPPCCEPLAIYGNLIYRFPNSKLYQVRKFYDVGVLQLFSIELDYAPF